MSGNTSSHRQTKIPPAYAQEFEEGVAKKPPRLSTSAVITASFMVVAIVFIAAAITNGLSDSPLTGPAYSASKVRPSITADVQLREIWWAMEAYHDTHNCYPPAYSTDVIGRPLHSWRTLLLPYLSTLDAETLSERIDYDKPWDDPDNATLLADHSAFPQEYRFPNEESHAIYLVRGLGWPIDGTSSPTRAELAALNPPRIVLLRVSPQTMNWAEPSNGDRTQQKIAILEAVIQNERPELTVHALLSNGDVVDLREIDLGTLSEITEPVDP